MGVSLSTTASVDFVLHHVRRSPAMTAKAMTALLLAEPVYRFILDRLLGLPRREAEAALEALAERSDKLAGHHFAAAGLSLMRLLHDPPHVLDAWHDGEGIEAMSLREYSSVHIVEEVFRMRMDRQRKRCSKRSPVALVNSAIFRIVAPHFDAP